MTDQSVEASVAVPTRDAATLVLLRDGPRGVETCLLRRTDRASFVPSAHVFAGGGVDAGDHRAVTEHGRALISGLDDVAASRLTGVPSGGLAFWFAAVRECIEESAVAPALSHADGSPAMPTAVEVRRWRNAMDAGEADLVRLLVEAGFVIDAARIACFARWVTPLEAPKRFDTRFFAVAMPDAQEVVDDGREIVAHAWVTPSEGLARQESGEWTMILPTVQTLRALEGFDDVDSACAGLPSADPGTALMPEFVPGSDGSLLRLAGDPEGGGDLFDVHTSSVLDAADSDGGVGSVERS